jgi:DNA-binding NarL/FixJ family response regulator
MNSQKLPDMFQTLIAEDNVVFRQSLREVLARRFPDMAIDEAADGEQAIHQGMARRHDLVFMDINMPGKNGLEVTRAIKDGDHEAVVCLVTNYDIQEYRDAADACGADHFIVKDEFTESLIVGLVQSVFDR